MAEAKNYRVRVEGVDGSSARYFADLESPDDFDPEGGVYVAKDDNLHVPLIPVGEVVEVWEDIPF